MKNGNKFKILFSAYMSSNNITNIPCFNYLNKMFNKGIESEGYLFFGFIILTIR